jgi:hypothetical protein
MEKLTQDQTMTVLVVYASALLPLIIILLLSLLKKVPRWVLVVYGMSFMVCAIGWEIWFTYGLVGGEPVDARRPQALSHAIPQDINWIVNSLADAGAVCMVGLLIVWLVYRFKDTPFCQWQWGAFIILLIWFIAQNLFVEMIIYHQQLAEGVILSWAPLAPGGPWLNPTLFSIAGRNATLQGQISWVLMTPLFYWTVLWARKKYDGC